MDPAIIVCLELGPLFLFVYIYYHYVLNRCYKILVIINAILRLDSESLVLSSLEIDVISAM